MNTAQPLNLLLVEDDDALLLFFTRALRRAGYHVETCRRGDEGLEMALSGRFDLLLLDWHLPGLDGHAVLSRIRAAGTALHVLMLTGYGDTHREAALQAGADAFLEKPCGLEELVGAVAKFTKPSVAAAA